MKRKIDFERYERMRGHIARYPGKNQEEGSSSAISRES
jgi:hypothetical protein